jgi:hypothetical protein
MDKKKVIKTNTETYNQYVKAGFWVPKGNVLFNIGISGKVEAEALVKGRDKRFIPVTIIINDYFYNKVQYRR